jgi:hypothetical protein
MASKKYTISAHGVVEHNFLASEATRQIEAQTPVADSITTLENGMILFIDRKADEITFDSSDSCPYLMHSTVRYYRAGGERGANHFVFNVDNEEELPRLWKLSEGDKFHTNLISYLDSEFADDDAVDTAFAAGSLYGYPDGAGMIKVTATVDNNSKSEFIVSKSTMPNDEVGFFVQVNRA